jgi:hypothetical protein
MPPFAHSLAWAIVAALPPFAHFGDWRCSHRAFARFDHYRAFYWCALFIGDRCCTLCGHSPHLRALSYLRTDTAASFAHFVGEQPARFRTLVAPFLHPANTAAHCKSSVIDASFA